MLFPMVLIIIPAVGQPRISGEVTYRNLDYLSGFGDTGEVYYLRAECSPEAGSNKDIQIKGTWIP